MNNTMMQKIKIVFQTRDLKRYYFLLLLNLCQVMQMQSQTAVAPSGVGTSGSPYLIETWQHLYWISQNSGEWDKHFLQTAHIDFATASPAITTWNSNAGWTPIGNTSTRFTGTYNGGVYTISNLYIDRSSTDYQGFFGATNGATILDLGLTRLTITARNRVGGLIGDMEAGSVTSVYMQGTINGGTDAIGGLVGHTNSASTIIESFTIGAVNGSGVSTGGFVGGNLGEIENCFSLVSVTVSGTDDRIGGLVGHNFGSDAKIITSYAAGAVSATNGGGLAGRSDNGASISNSYWDNQTSTKTSSAGGTGLSTADMKDASNFSTWDFTDDWKLSSSLSFDGYPVLEWTKSYPKEPSIVNGKRQIGDLANLLWIADATSRWGHDYLQTTHLDAMITQLWDNNNGWAPIGNTSTKFTGSYDGGGKTISNLFIDRQSTDRVGMFGETDNATITQLGLVNPTIKGANLVGGLIGISTNGGVVSKCFVRGGRVVGFNSPDGFIGGLIGRDFGGATISDVYTNTTVSNAVNTEPAAGLVGQYDGSTINRAYVAGAVHPNAITPGFPVPATVNRRAIGQQSGGTCNTCYFDVTLNSDVNPGQGTAKTTTEMQQQATFTSWDFQCESANGTADIWGIDEGNDYPRLSWEGFVQNCTQVVEVVGSAGANGVYASLKDAFDAINANTQSSSNDIEIKLLHSSIETASAVLNEGAWNSLVLYPIYAGLRISGNLAAPLIDLNGADRVTIDGRVNLNGSTKSLVIENENTTLATGNSTLRFVEAAQNNTVRYTIIKSAAFSDYANETSGLADNFGIITPALGAICFHTDASETGGNSNNLIEFCDLTNSGGNRPYALITSVGSGSFHDNNQDNIIRNNHFYDFEAMRQGGAIIIRTGSRQWEITDNHFFQPNNVTYKADANVAIIIVINNGRNYKVNRNVFGGTTPNAGGGKYVIAHASNDVGFGFITINSAETIGVTEIKDNVFRNLDVSAGNINNAFISGLSGHPLKIQNNVIGTQHTTGDIILRGASFRGIVTGPTSTTGSFTDTITGNTMGGLSLQHTAEQQFYGIYSFANFINSSHRARNAYIAHNTIGSPTQSESILMNTGGQVETMVGIFIDFESVDRTVYVAHNTIVNMRQTSTHTLSSINGIRFIRQVISTVAYNEIYNLSSNALNANKNLTTFASSSAVVGINDQSSRNSVIRSNTIAALTLTASNAPGQIIGIARFASSATGTVNDIEGNFIHSLAITNPASTAAITGVFLATHAVTHQAWNNIISISSGADDYAVTGMHLTNTTGNIYFNTIYIDGSVVSASAPSYCMYIEGGTTNAVKNIRNNILENRRTTSTGATKHYAIAFHNYTSTANTTLDFNNYRATGVDGVLGLFNGSDVSSLPIATGLDANSTSTDPSFINNSTPSISEEFFPTASLAGTPISGFASDFNLLTRGTTPTMGAMEEKVVLWLGITSTDWNLPSNWYNGVTPATGENVKFAAQADFDIQLDASKSLGTILFNNSRKKVRLGSFDLTISKPLPQSTSASYILTNGTGVLIANIADQNVFEFAVGNTTYNPVTITNNTGAADVFSVRVLDEVYENGLTGNIMNSFPRITRTWDIAKNNPTANSGDGVDFVFHWNSGEADNLTADYKLFHYGSSWQAQPNTPTITGNTLSYAEYKGTFSPFAIGSETTPLPVTLLHFSAVKVGNQVELDWATVSETHNSHFEVLHSSDGTVWTQIGTVQGAGYSNQKQTYDFMHSEPSALNYYRLRQIDLDGKSMLTDVRVVQFAKTEVNKVQVYPNPSNGTITIKSPYEQAEITLYDLQGKQILRQALTTNTNMNNLAQGVYLLKIHTPNGFENHRIIVQ